MTTTNSHPVVVNRRRPGRPWPPLAQLSEPEDCCSSRPRGRRRPRRDAISPVGACAAVPSPCRLPHSTMPPPPPGRGRAGSGPRTRRVCRPAPTWSAGTLSRSPRPGRHRPARPVPGRRRSSRSPRLGLDRVNAPAGRTKHTPPVSDPPRRQHGDASLASSTPPANLAYGPTCWVHLSRVNGRRPAPRSRR